MSKKKKHKKHDEKCKVEGKHRERGDTSADEKRHDKEEEKYGKHHKESRKEIQQRR